ncbi:MAG: S-layer homology domain-containing protein [Flavonifractor plautii]
MPERRGNPPDSAAAPGGVPRSPDGSQSVPPKDIPNDQRHGKAAPLTEPAGDHRLKGRQQSVPEKKRCIKGGGEKQRRGLRDLLPDRPEGRSQQIDRGANLEAEDQQGECFHYRDHQIWRQRSVAEGCQTKQPAHNFHRQGNWASDLTHPVLQRYHQHHHGITHGDLHGIPGPGRQGGTGDGKFSPDAPCTRAQMATFLWRAVGSPTPESGENIFVDVPADSWYIQAVQWVYAQKITNGTGSGKFSPDAVCTRAQMLKNASNAT